MAKREGRLGAARIIINPWFRYYGVQSSAIWQVCFGVFFRSMILCVPQSKSILQASGTAVDVSTDFGPLEKQHTAVLQFLTRTAVQQRNVTSDLVAGIASHITFRVRSHILASRRVLRPSLARTVLATDVLEAPCRGFAIEESRLWTGLVNDAQIA